MSRGNLKQIILMATTMAVVPAAGAMERVNVDRIIACANEPDDARRLACYDSAIAKAKAPVSETQSAPAPIAATKPAVPEPAAPPAVVATEDEFGVDGSLVARQRRAEQDQEKSKVEARSISAEVAEVSSRPRGELVVTLNSGQVWVQKDAERFPIKPGDHVTINAGTLGSFHLVNGKRSTRVTRVK